MAEKIERSIPWLAISAICLLAVFGVGVVLNETMADTITPSVTVGNQAPTVGTVTLNGGSAITLTENTTVVVTGTTSVTDGNSYTDLTSVTSTLYLTNTSSCGTYDPNWCYNVSQLTCATNTCSGNSCVASCTANVWFIAEPSDGSSTYPDDAWKMEITVVDSGSNSDSESSTQELNTASYMDASTTIGYGTVSPGATSSEAEINATNTGNWPVDMQLSGVNMESTSNATIAVGQQKYSTDSSMGDWVGTALSGTPTTLDVILNKPTATTSNATDSIYWMIKIPDPQETGTYTGTNTSDAIWAATTS